ncbi:hypothetical protein GIB67_038658 [Kingdonia uniflora]|uniref:Uncharacterized protein n=1 Tax=Kingdonia uniflora TaxID=39325 RepID=A0A7J7NPP5_9MAGN|nr:hypothetical protein GIB67_038658 [Kingdonia uniflora]
MAAPAVGPSPSHSAQVVGNAFVEQYYHILHQSPEMVFRFYQESSVLSRPGIDSVMTAVTTMKGINDMILSLDYKNYKAEIKTADAQDSHESGVTVLVTGCLTGKKDNVKRNFAQSFFLAPQDKGYYVLNDVFRYVDESESREAVSVNGIIESTPTAIMTPDSENSHVPDFPVPITSTSPTVETPYSVKGVPATSDNGEGIVMEDEVVAESPVLSNPDAVHSVQNEVHSNPNEIHATAEPVSTVEEEVTKKSYATIVKDRSLKAPHSPIYVPTKAVKVVPISTEKKSGRTDTPVPPAPPPKASAPPNNNATESSNAHEEVEGYSIYIRNLPLNATFPQVEEEFMKFGTIKPGGVQVRSNKGYCFGFVEFELPESVQSAVEAASVKIGGRQAFIEEKKTTSRGNFPCTISLTILLVITAVSGRGRFLPVRGGFRSNFRGRGNFGGGRGYGRNEFGNRGDFSGRRGPPGRGGEGRGGEDIGYKRVDQSVNGRGGLQGGNNQTTVPV